MIGTLPQNNCRKKETEEKKASKDHIIINIWVHCAPFVNTQSSDSEKTDRRTIFRKSLQLLWLNFALYNSVKIFGKTA